MQLECTKSDAAFMVSDYAKKVRNLLLEEKHAQKSKPCHKSTARCIIEDSYHICVRCFASWQISSRKKLTYINSNIYKHQLEVYSFINVISMNCI